MSGICSVLTASEMAVMPLKRRFIVSLLQEKANWHFANSVLDILQTRGKDPRIPTYKANRETAWECYYAVKRLYDSEYGKLDSQAESVINTEAKEIADKALTLYGWKGDDEE